MSTSTLPKTAKTSTNPPDPLWTQLEMFDQIIDEAWESRDTAVEKQTTADLKEPKT